MTPLNILFAIILTGMVATVHINNPAPELMGRDTVAVIGEITIWKDLYEILD
jgi:hypothetical protein